MAKGGSLQDVSSIYGPPTRPAVRGKQDLSSPDCDDDYIDEMVPATTIRTTITSERGRERIYKRFNKIMLFLFLLYAGENRFGSGSKMKRPYPRENLRELKKEFQCIYQW